LGPNLVIDPISEEESYQDGSLMITCMPSRYEVTQLTITGEWSSARINEVRESELDKLVNPENQPTPKGLKSIGIN